MTLEKTQSPNQDRFSDKLYIANAQKRQAYLVTNSFGNKLQE